jgi:hypothetical protein
MASSLVNSDQAKIAEFHDSKFFTATARKLAFKSDEHQREVYSQLTNLSRRTAQHCLTEQAVDGTVYLTVPFAMSSYQKGGCENKRHLQERKWKIQARLQAKLEKKAGGGA